MTRWKLQIAGGLALCGLFALSPPSSRAGWRTKAEKRPKAAPADCEFGYFGTNWRAWPEGCRGWPACASQSLPHTHPQAPPVIPSPQSELSLPMTRPDATWDAPSSNSLSPDFQTPASPSPWSIYREHLPSPNSAPTYAVPQNPSPQFGPPRYSAPLQFAPPSQPAPGNGPKIPPSVPPPSLPLPQAAPPNTNPSSPAPQASRGLVPPWPTTKAPMNASGIQPAGASIRKNAAPAMITLGAPQPRGQDTPPPNFDRRAPVPSFSSVPKSLTAPTDVPESRPMRSQNPVMLMSIE